MQIVTKIIKNYLFYALSSLLRLSLFYYIATNFGQHSFVAYNAYVFYSEIAMSIVCAGTNSAFMLNNNMQARLSSIILFENLFLLVLAGSALGAYALQLWNFGQNISLPLLFAITLGRVNNQIFCRYFNFNHSIARSIWNDIIGNYLWIIVVPLLVYFTEIKNVTTFIYYWACILLVNNLVNLHQYRREIFLPNAYKNFTAILKIYYNSLQFTLVNTLFATVTSVIMIHKYTDINVVASYLVSAKVVGFLTDVTTGFTGVFLCNNLTKLDHTENKINWFFLTSLLINLSAFALIFCVLLLFGPLIQHLLRNQLALSYISLLLWLIPLYALNNMRSLNGIYFQRHGLLHYLNVISIFQLLLLGMLYQIPINVYGFIGLQIIFIGLFFLIDVFYWFKYGYHRRLIMPSNAVGQA